jgi:glycosyltransferase involved in cell wall biosynthesis
MDHLGASFVQDEIIKVAAIFKEVVIITEDSHRYDFPENVKKFILPNVSKKSKITVLLRSFWTIHVILISDFFSKGTSFSYLKQYLIRQSYLMQYLSLSRGLKFNFNFDKTDVLYAFFTYNNAALPVLLAKKFNCKFITCTHGRDLYEDREPTTGKLAFRNYIFSNASIILSVSNKGKEYLQDRYPKYVGKMQTYYLGTKKINDKHNTQVENDKVVIVSCANIMTSNIKRIELIPPLLIELAKHTDRNIEWVHFGNYDFELNKLLEIELEKKALKENNQITITFKGPTGNPEILSYYASNPVSLFLSVSSSEGLPFSMMEASSYGIPIVCTDVGGCKEITNKDLLLPASFSGSDFIKVYERFIQNENKYRTEAFNLWEKGFSFESSLVNFKRLVR